MRNVSIVVPFALLFALGMAGCDNSAERDAEQAERDPATATDPAAESEEQRSAALDEQQQQDQQMQQPQTSMPGAQSGGEVSLTVEESQQFGEYLADAQGRPLYVYEQDSEGQSTCYDTCAENWPPLTADMGMPSAQDPAIDESNLDTIQRDDGTMQVTYNGKPLYYYAEDLGTGEPSGEQGDWALADTGGAEVQRVSDEM